MKCECCGAGLPKILFDKYQLEVDEFEKGIKKIVMKILKGGGDNVK